MDPYEIEDTSDWFGSPTPLETCRHQLRMYENEFDELNLLLREAREKIFKLVEMHTEAIQQRDEAMANLRSRSGEAANLRKEIYDLKISERFHEREARKFQELLAGQVDESKNAN
ncbi:hypothetical protein DKY63_05590 [Pseudomonas putida]|uniref:Uncharacterized protein n=1 Tax=Pseudomonas putida TaxID=303 RepID=A0A2Z4RF84_PSEPU|nr:hypothetical protein [Pseudomonas putida]AWY39405.1 hypothetical protein DKY63_05590 [Pseudomonas putida]